MSKHRIFALFLLLASGLFFASPATAAIPTDEAGLANRIQNLQRVMQQLDNCISSGDAGNFVLFDEARGCLVFSRTQLADWITNQTIEHAPYYQSWQEVQQRVNTAVAIYAVTSKKTVAALRIVRSNMFKQLADAKARLAALRARPAGPSQPGGGNACSTAAGDWKSVVPGMGSSVWRLKGSGGFLDATESGWGNATGNAQFSRGRLRIDFQVNNVTGFYDWELEADCRSGKGWLEYTKGMSGRHPSTVSR